jgi:hypothetical protein
VTTNPSESATDSGLTVTQGVSVNELRGVMADLFLSTAQVVARRIQQAGLPLTATVRQTAIERDHQGPGSWRTADRSVASNILTVEQLAFRAAPLLQEPEFENVRRSAERLASSAQATLPYWAPFGPRAQLLVGPVTERGPANPDPTEDLAGWAANFILLPALQSRFAALPSLERLEETAALAFADEVIRVAHDEHLRYRVIIPLSGIDLDISEGDTFTRGPISIRHLSELEQGQWFMELGALSGMHLLMRDPPRVVAEFSFAGPRTRQHMTYDDLVTPLTTAFQLHGYPLAGQLATQRSDPAWVLPFSPNIPLTLPRRSNDLSVITREDFTAVITTKKQLEPYHLRIPRSAKDLALHRFIGGIARETPADAVVDFTIALEALLLPYDEATRRSDLGYRFRMHGAHYLSDSVGQRTTVARQMRVTYNMRSGLVHGGEYPEQQKITAVGDDAKELARIGLLRAVQDGFPTASHFNRMVLGVEEDEPTVAEHEPAKQGV